MSSGARQTGFSMTELLITLVVAAVLLGVAAPSMQAASQNARISALHNSLTGSLQLARSEAIKRTSFVTVCARGNDDASCGTDWKNGWIVFVDAGTTKGSIEAGETILAVSPPVGSAVRMANRGKLASGSGGIAARPFIRFTGRGTSNWRGGGVFVFCDSRGAANLSALNIVLTGDIRKARKSNGNVIDAFGTSATCPTSDSEDA